MTAKNAISNATSATVELFVYAPIVIPKILIISDIVNLLENKPITFFLYTYSGSDVNLKWDFGDYSDPVITSTREIKHTYSR